MNILQFLITRTGYYQTEGYIKQNYVNLFQLKIVK